MKEKARFERNMKVIHEAKIDYEVLDDQSLHIKTTRGEMIFYPTINHFKLDYKMIYGNAKRMIDHLKINRMLR